MSTSPPLSGDRWRARRRAIRHSELGISGSSRNRDHFLPYFTKVFNLRVDDDTMRRRLEARTDDDWPLGQEGVELMLELNRSDEGPAGAIDVDATQPLDQVVDEVLRLAS